MATDDSIPFQFDQFDLKEPILRAVREAGFRVPSPIQAEALPVVSEGRDLIAQAHTGTGKTAAFCLPAMNRMTMQAGVELLVIAPTRELANQVSDEVYRLGKYAGVTPVTVCGGQAYGRQIQLINRGAQVLVATPGRLLDLLKSKKLKDFKPSIVVLDEADEMLDMGFLDDIKEIFTYLPAERQTLLFSATMPKPIRALAETILKNPRSVQTETGRESANVDIRQLYFVIEEREREEAVVRLIEDQMPEKAILFCRTRVEVDQLSSFLAARGYPAKSLHGDMDQNRRNEVMQGFRKGQFDLLVATDVAARGLDVADLSHVFNFHIPFNSKSYIHRIGRTGRAGRKGTAITLVSPHEFRQLQRIEQLTGSLIEHGMVPGLRQLRLSRLARLRETLDETPIMAEARELVANLREDMRVEDLAARLASYILASQQESGPEQIGPQGEQLEAIIRPRGGARREGGSYGARGGGGGRWRKRFPAKGSGEVKAAYPGKRFGKGSGKGAGAVKTGQAKKFNKKYKGPPKRKD